RHVVGLVEDEHAARAEDGLEEAPVAVPGMEDLCRAGQDLLDQCRVGDRDDPAKRHDLHREHVAVAALGPASVGHEPLEREIALKQHRQAGAPGRRDSRGLRRTSGYRAERRCGCHGYRPEHTVPYFRWPRWRNASTHPAAHARSAVSSCSTPLSGYSTGTASAP